MRRCPSANDVVRIESAAGAVKAALTPLMKRVAIRSVGSLATVPSADAAARAMRPASRAPRRGARGGGEGPRGRPPRAPEPVGAPPTEQQDPAVAENERRDDPLQRRL